MISFHRLLGSHGTETEQAATAQTNTPSHRGHRLGSGTLSDVQLRTTNEFKDKFVAPEISSFTEASIPDVSGSQERWLVSFILNSALVVQLDDATRRIFYNFLRRVEGAFREYISARQMTMTHLANPNPNAVSEYIIAIGHWEAVLSQTYQAWCLMARGQQILFERGDGSGLQRLNLLYNRTKHAEKAITAEQLPLDGTLPVWLKNDGLHSVETSLTFEEIAEMLEELAVWAEAAQNPATMRDKIAAKYGINPDELS
jgi:hypothetical protein